MVARCVFTAIPQAAMPIDGDFAQLKMRPRKAYKYCYQRTNYVSLNPGSNSRAIAKKMCAKPIRTRGSAQKRFYNWEFEEGSDLRRISSVEIQASQADNGKELACSRPERQCGKALAGSARATRRIPVAALDLPERRGVEYAAAGMGLVRGCRSARGCL